MLLSFVVPAYNEVDSIGYVVEEVGSVVTPLLGAQSFEVIVVDDGSNDGTGEKIAALLYARPWLSLWCHERRAGKSMALRTGFARARARWIVTMDADGQNDPGDVLPLLQRIGRGGDRTLFAGVRDRRHDGIVRAIGSKVANRLRQQVLHDGCRDSACGLKVLPRSLATRLPYFDGMHRFMPALARREGFAIEEFAAHDRPRRSGRSKYGNLRRLLFGTVDMLGVFWLARRSSDPGEVKPIRR